MRHKMIYTSSRRLLSSSCCRLLSQRNAAASTRQRRSPRRLPPNSRNTKQTDNRPITKVEKIVIKATKEHSTALEETDTAARVVESFSKLNLRQDVVNALEGIHITKPTVIQTLAIPKILRGKNIICASETGSGKTVAYLAPLISKLRDEEEHHGLVARLGKPRALILLPSRDLASQVLSVIKSLCHVARVRAVGLIGGTKRKFVKEAMEAPVDIAVATPQSLLKYRHTKRVSLSDVSHLVIDEADTLFDATFDEEMRRIFEDIAVRSKKPSSAMALGEDAQVTIVGATLSNKMFKTVSSFVPNVRTVCSKNLHRVLPNVQQTFYKVRQDMKSEKLLSVVMDNPKDVFMVFCNTVSSCDWTSHFLKSQDIPAVRIHAGLYPSERAALLKEFTSGNCRVLICTDIASRGIDLTQVTHVVLFDFPNSTADYLHRLGRTGRVGSKGSCRVTALMSHRRDIRTAYEIKDAAENKTALMNKKVNRILQQQIELSRSHTPPQRVRA